MNRFHLILAAFTLIPLVQSCALGPSRTPEKRDDPLIGRIIEARTADDISFNDLISAIAGNEVIYLSEKHDNPDQHKAQERIIRALAEYGRTSGRQPGIGFEFFAMAHTPDLLNFMDAKKVDHPDKVRVMVERDLRMKLGWMNQPDSLWQFYFSLLSLARELDLPVAGLDLAPAVKKRITRKGMTGLTPLEAETIFSTGLDNPAYKSRMSDIFRAVHCGMGHERMQARLYDSWVARNDKMAHSITRLLAHSTGPVIIIMGNGHTEYGLGVMDRVAAIRPDTRQVNIGLTEISTRPAALESYLMPLELEGYDPVPPADFLWFFQRVSYTDPCLRFRKSLEKMKQRKTK